MAGTPIILNVRWYKTNVDSKRKMVNISRKEDYKQIGSLHDYRKWEDKVAHGEWVKPVWSRVQTMVGSVPTPYIIDDKVDVVEVSEAIRYWYDIPRQERKKLD